MSWKNPSRTVQYNVRAHFTALSAPAWICLFCDCWWAWTLPIFKVCGYHKRGKSGCASFLKTLRRRIPEWDCQCFLAPCKLIIS